MGTTLFHLLLLHFISLSSYYEKFLATGEVKCIDEEIPFEIPNGWEWVRLGNIATIIGGYAYKSQDFINSSNNQVLRLGNIKNDFLKHNASPVYISDDLATKTDKFRCHLDDILITMTGTRKKRDYFFSYKVKQNDQNYFINQRVGILRFYISEVSMFMIYALKAENTLQNVFQYETGTANQGNLGAENIAKVYIPLPPLSEQLRIVSKIKELIPLVEAYEQTQNELNTLNTSLNELLCKSILQEAIQGKLVLQVAEEGTAQELLERIRQEKLYLVKEGKLKKSALTDSVIYKGDDNKYWEKNGKTVIDVTDEIPFDIPITWQWVRIKDIFQINPKNIAEDNCISAFIPMEKICATYGSKFSYDEVQWKTIKTGYTHFADGDVAFAKITPCFQNRKSAIFYNLPNGIGAGTTELKVLRQFGETINRWYLLIFLESPYFIDEAIFKGTANQQRIISGYLENKLFPLPPLQEQNRIEKQIKAIASIMRG